MNLFNIVVDTKIVNRLSAEDGCKTCGDDFESLLAVHRDYEQW